MQKKLSIREIAVFGMLGAIMYASKIIMEVVPNVHLLGTLTMVYTLVYRKKALYPIYIYIMLNGFFAGFSVWWFAYTYIWAVLWGITMLLPQNMPKKVAPIVYMLVCAAHGFLFGTLYAPAQALLFGLDFEQTVAWIIAGLPWDVIHGVSNFFVGMLIMPLSRLLGRIERRSER